MLVVGQEGFAGSLGHVLCLGAHGDDIEIGCGGTILKLLEAGAGRISVEWVVFSAPEGRKPEATRSAMDFLREAKETNIVVESFRMSYFPYEGASIKERFDQLGERSSPDLIFTHNREDLHQDHRLISELTWNTFRNHLILEYEVPKYDGDLGRPNVFVHLDRQHCDRKVRNLLNHFQSQRDKPWFTEDTFRATMRLRGIESRAPSGFAEGFHARKVVLA
jgi:LmbE family N-acetylglucosaminyl deacetylase